ncbi:MAG TPA: hypothetical protein VF401_03045 [Candidatus Saccharimonadales bacterium]
MQNTKTNIRLHILALLLCMIVAGIATYILGQDLNWDLLNYHWYNPWALFHHRFLYDIQPAGGGTFINPLLDLPNYLLRSQFKPVIAGTLLGAIQGINGWLVFEIANNLLKDYIKRYVFRFVIALAIGVVSLFGATGISELGNSMGDNLTSLLILAALLLLLTSFDTLKKPGMPRRLRFYGYVLAGIAVGLKLTSLVFVIPLFIGGFLMKGNNRTKIRESVWHVFAILAGLVAATGYWSFELWRHLGNPIFPYYNGVFKSAYMPSVNLSDRVWFPTNLVDTLFYPFTFAHVPDNPLRPYFRDPRLAVLFVIVLAAGAYFLIERLVFKSWPKLRLTRKEGVFWIFVVLSYVFWQKQFAYYRYLLPLELISLTAIALATYKIISSKRLATCALVITFGLITAYTIPANWGRIPWQSEDFGPNLSGQLSYANGTVIMAPANPLGFLVPYLPAGSRVISVAAFDTITPAQKHLVVSAIQQDQAHHKAFYGIETTNGVVTETKYFREAGFVNSECTPLNTYVSQYLYSGALGYKICSLTKL